MVLDDEKMTIHFFLNTFDLCILGLQALGLFWLGYKMRVESVWVVVSSWSMAALFYLLVATALNGIIIK